MITSYENPLVKKVRSLQNKQKERKKEKLFVAEGLKMVEEAPKELIEELIISESLLNKYNGNINLKSATIVSEKVMKHISTSITPQGIIAIIKQNTRNIEEINFKDNPLVIALENIQDPGNLGTIIRTAESSGARCILLSKGTVDLYNPKVIRATMGSIFRVPIVKNLDLINTVNYLKENDIKVYAAHLNTDKFYYDCNFANGTCFLIGNEGNGLTDKLSNLTDSKIKIPILGKAESLNASMAAGILMYESVRQRLR